MFVFLELSSVIAFNPFLACSVIVMLKSHFHQYYDLETDDVPIQIDPCIHIQDEQASMVVSIKTRVATENSTITRNQL